MAGSTLPSLAPLPSSQRDQFAEGELYGLEKTLRGE